MEKDSPPYTARLLIGCPDRPGIVAAVSGFLFERGANIVSPTNNPRTPAGGGSSCAPSSSWGSRPPLGASVCTQNSTRTLPRVFAMDWEMRWWEQRRCIAILVSRHDHCLFDLLWRWRRGEMSAEIAAVISNHRDLEQEIIAAGVAFHHVPMKQGGKERAEATMLELLQGNAELLVLARYMQILSGDFLQRVGMPAINIHHSFLPAFAGADPYGRC
jgi:formyltetrahydrofolate deformylase